MSVKRIPILFTVLAIAAALVLSGCGGGDNDDATTASGAAETTSQRDSGAEAGHDSGKGDGAEPIDTADLPEPQEGSKQAAPGVPVSRGGDNSIQTWGLEASASERAQVTAVVQAFLDARAAANWATACSYLAAEQRAEFEGFVKGAKRGIAACAQAMGALAQGVPAGAFDEEAQIDYVLSLRVGEGHAFLVYTRTGENKIYATALGNEGGTWKVISVGPTVLN